MRNPLYEKLRESAKANGMNVTFMQAFGDEPDSLNKGVIWVYDSEIFPFYQAEVYNQFKDGTKSG